MKRIIAILILLIGVLNTQAQESKSKEIKEISFNCAIDCHSCEKKIMSNIPYEKGVKDVSVDLENHKVTIKYRNDKNNEQNLLQALNNLGYKTTLISNKANKQ